MTCPHCGKEIPPALLAAEIGKHTSDKKAAAARKNGRKGGRPKKEKPE